MSLETDKRETGNKMPLRVGTIVKRYEVEDCEEHGYFPCESLNTDIRDEPDRLDVCVGIIQTQPTLHNPIVRVHWVQMCNYHENAEYSTDSYNNCDNLWEVGQLA